MSMVSHHDDQHHTDDNIKNEDNIFKDPKVFLILNFVDGCGHFLWNLGCLP